MVKLGTVILLVGLALLVAAYADVLGVSEEPVAEPQHQNLLATYGWVFSAVGLFVSMVHVPVFWMKLIAFVAGVAIVWVLITVIGT